MKLLEMKKKVLKLIEEISTDKNKLTDDPDIEAKLNDVINQIQFEVARMKKIPVIKKVEITDENMDFDLRSLEQFYQLESLKQTAEDGTELDFNLFGHFVEFEEVGMAKFKYYKMPIPITEETNDNEYEFELSEDALEVIPYGVAADLLKSDVSNNYGKIYAERYETMLQRLDPRENLGMIYIGE